MDNISRLLFGYVTISFDKKHTKNFYNYLHKHCIVNWGYSEAEDKASAKISLIDYPYFSSFSEELGFAFEKTPPRGLPGLFYKYRKRYGLWIGLFLMAVITLLSSLFVWDVRIIGAQAIDESVIIENLKKEGLSVGTFIPKIQSTEIANAYLSHNNNLAWMSINPKGNVIFVEVIEETSVEKEPRPVKYSNIVASEDAVVESISHSRGEVITRIGKTVKKGDLLISGVYSSPRKYSFVRASGEILGRVNRTLEITIPYSQSIKQYKNPEKMDISINFFGFEIKIFSFSGKLPSKYDTIYRKEQLVLFDEIKLPIYVNVSEFLEYEDISVIITQEQAVEMAFSKMKSELSRLVCDADIISQIVEGVVLDDSYVLRCNAVCLKNIASELEFQME